jgi:hypothetical protein
MNIAFEQLNAKVQEHGDYDSFTKMMYQSVVATEVVSNLPPASALFAGSKLLNAAGPQTNLELLRPNQLRLNMDQLKSALHNQLGKELEKRNPK